MKKKFLGLLLVISLFLPSVVFTETRDDEKACGEALVKAGEYYNNQMYDEAIVEVTKAIELNPKDAKAYIFRGLVYSDKGNLDQALIEFNKAMEINPNDAEAYNHRGLVYYRKGNLDKALLGFNKAIEINPKYAQSYNNRSGLYFVKKDYDKSWLDINKAEELGYKVNPEFVGALKKASGREK